MSEAACLHAILRVLEQSLLVQREHTRLLEAILAALAQPAPAASLRLTLGPPVAK